MGVLAWLVMQTKGMSEYVRRCQIKMMCTQATFKVFKEF